MGQQRNYPKTLQHHFPPQTAMGTSRVVTVPAPIGVEVSHLVGSREVCGSQDMAVGWAGKRGPSSLWA